MILALAVTLKRLKCPKVVARNESLGFEESSKLEKSEMIKGKAK